jgi:hypothetical protein
MAISVLSWAIRPLLCWSCVASATTAYCWRCKDGGTRRLPALLALAPCDLRTDKGQACTCGTGPTHQTLIESVAGGCLHCCCTSLSLATGPANLAPLPSAARHRTPTAAAPGSWYCTRHQPKATPLPLLLSLQSAPGHLVRAPRPSHSFGRRARAIPSAAGQSTSLCSLQPCTVRSPSLFSLVLTAHPQLVHVLHRLSSRLLPRGCDALHCHGAAARLQALSHYRNTLAC